VSVYGSSLSSVRATALGTESFYLVSHIIFKAFNYTYLHNTMIMNMSHIFSYRVNLKKKSKTETYLYNKDQQIEYLLEMALVLMAATPATY